MDSTTPRAPKTRTPRAPKIRSMPGQRFVLTQDELTELRLRQQALVTQRATLILMQAGYKLHVETVLKACGIEPAETGEANQWQINLDTGDIVRARR